METTSNKSKTGNRVFYTILVLLILGSIGATFYKIVIQKNYQITAETSCNPTTESCFHYEGVICETGDLECVSEDAYDYKLISKKASDIYICEQTDEKLGCYQADQNEQPKLLFTSFLESFVYLRPSKISTVRTSRQS